MTIVLHPDELLERDRSELSRHELAIVEAHLAECAECRLLVDARHDFRAERAEDSALEPPVSLLPPDFIEELARRAERERDLPRPKRRKISFKALPLIAAALFAAGAAAQTGGLTGLSSNHPADPVRAASPAFHMRIREHTRAVSSSKPKSADAAKSIDAAPALASAEPGMKPPPAQPPSIPVMASTSTAATKALPLTDESTSNPGAGATRPAMTVTPDAATLFDRAAEARSKGDYARALGLYRDLEQRYPDSDEARASHAIVARLLLDTGKNRAALDDYNQYLAEKPADLTEEALVGRALAFQRLGRSADERTAWSTLLRKFPSSVHSGRARARIEATREAASK